MATLVSMSFNLAQPFFTTTNVFTGEIYRGVDVPGGLVPLPEGGRLLLFETITLNDTPVEVMLTLHRSPAPSGYDIMARFSVNALPENLRMRLQINDQVYTTHVSSPIIVFEDVQLPVEDAPLVVTIHLTLEA